MKAVIISTKPEQAEQIAAECSEAGMERIWFQKGMGKGSGTKEAVALARKKELDVVYGVCPMMFFGGLPKEWAG